MKAWKVQKFFGDVVYDLRSRGLLPVVGLLLVAMVAIPVLISRGSSADSTPALQPTSGAVTEAPEAQNAVVSYAPGVRNYKKRLDDLAAKDPFKQPASAAVDTAAASQLTSTVGPDAGSGGSASSGTSVSSGGTSSGSTATKPRFFLFHSVADVSFGDLSQPLQRHKRLKNYASLPNATAPVLIYLGSTLDQKRALFAVSKYTDQLTGPGICTPGPTDCSLLALAPGQAEDMVYAGDGKTYRVKVNKITLKRRNVDLGG